MKKALWILLPMLVVLVTQITLYRFTKPRFDWHEVCIEGFPARVTLSQLRASLGPPTTIEGGQSVWLKKEDEIVVKFREDKDGNHLIGNRITINGQVLAKSWELRPSFNITGGVEDGILHSRLVEMLGKDKVVAVRHDEEGHTTHYQDVPESPGGHELIVNLSSIPHRDDKEVFNFELFWR